MPVALALCSNTLNPAANTGAEGAMAIAPSAITPHAFQLKAPRLRIPWILLAIESVDGTCPPAGPPPYDGGSPSGKAELGRLGAQIYLNVSPKRPRCQTRRARGPVPRQAGPPPGADPSLLPPLGRGIRS